MIYKNPYYSKTRSSFLMMVTCGYCKEDLVKYEKVGKGNLLKLHIDRVIEGKIDLSKKPKNLICPNCKGNLGVRIKIRKKEVYRMNRGTFNTRRLDY